jgi:hypothetical protein
MSKLVDGSGRIECQNYLFSLQRWPPRLPRGNRPAPIEPFSVLVRLSDGSMQP